MEESHLVGVQLIDALDGLKARDGTGNMVPDVIAREQALDYLLKHGLSSRELRHLKSQLSTITLTKDLFRFLPEDIRLLIVDYFDFPDVITAVLVSKAWKDIMFGDDVCRVVVKSHFRAQWYIHTSAKTEHSELELQNWFRDKLEACVRRTQRKPQSQRYAYRWENLRADRIRREYYMTWYRDYLETIRDQQTRNGRVAFRINSRSIAVKSPFEASNDFNVLFMSNDRSVLKDWVLTNKMLVATSGRSVLAYSFSERAYREFDLPAIVRHISADHDKFGVILEGNQILSGSFDGQIKPIHSHLPILQTHDAFGILHHPVSQNILFVLYRTRYNKMDATAGMEEEQTIQLVAQKFVDGKPLLSLATAEIDIHKIGLRTGRYDAVVFREFLHMPLHLGVAYVSFYIEHQRNIIFEFDIYTGELRQSDNMIRPRRSSMPDTDEPFSVQFDKYYYEVIYHDPMLKLSNADCWEMEPMDDTHKQDIVDIARHKKLTRDSEESKERYHNMEMKKYHYPEQEYTQTYRGLQILSGEHIDV